MESEETQNAYQMTLKSDTLRNFLCSTNHIFYSSKTDDFESHGVDFGNKKQDRIHIRAKEPCESDP